jgi:putative pyruvate formate lyase activating enzyme
VNKKIEYIDLALKNLEKHLHSCELCMHRCKVNRLLGEIGICNAGPEVEVFSYGSHHGEEPPISGTRGSGTIFFSHCNLKCVYCQNYKFSQLKYVKKHASDTLEDSINALAQKMLELEAIGCHNINLVSPTHYLYQIIKALKIAYTKGLTLPIVYNTGGYDNVEVIKLLDGIIDIYLPDMRYSEDRNSLELSGAPRYVDSNRLLLKEMFFQRNKLDLTQEGIALQGLIIRLLILPNNLSGTIETLRFLKSNVSKDLYISLMSQYHPTYKAKEHKRLNRRISKNEYERVLATASDLGITNGWIQGFHEKPDSFLGTNIKPLNS